jgi:hypothetical protein
MALWAEGPSDGPFLRPVLRRTVIEIASRSKRTVDIADEFISLPDKAPDLPRHERIGGAVAQRAGEISILFIHTDGQSDPETARARLVQPAIERIGTLPRSPRCVAVVPRRETEAWMLADPAALASALGINPDRLPDIPALSEIERTSDPKRRLAAARAGIRRRRTPELDLRQIGETVDLALLRRLPAFQSLHLELLAAMRGLGLK